MNERSKAPARFLAAAALVVGFLVLVAAIGGSLSSDSDETANGEPARQVTRKAADDRRRPPASYVVQNGDTLTSIARKTGVSVARIQELNPQVDPQILISGEKLELR